MSGLKIAEKLNLNSGGVYSLLDRYNVEMRSNKINSRKYSYNMDYFKNIDNNRKSYWLGFIYADGYIAGADENNKKLGIALSIQDKKHLLKFKKDIDAEYNVKEYESGQGYKGCKKYCRIQIFGEDIYNQLQNKGVLEHKSEYIEPPNIENKYKNSFIRGYFDGNGSIPCWDNKHETNTKNFSFNVTAHLNLIYYIKNFIEEKANIYAGKIYDREKQDNVVNFKIGGNLKVQKALGVIYKNAKVYLERKYRKYQMLCNQNVELHSNV